MVFKGLIAATAAVALSATPALASATAASNAARVASAQAEIAPAAVTFEDEGSSELLQRRGRGFFGNGWFIPAAVVVAIILGIIVFTKKSDNDGDVPASED